MPTTIRTREPRELLALIPYQLGFLPRESAVVVSLRGARSLVGLMARVDLGPLADGETGAPLAGSLVSHILGDGAQRAVLVLYTGADPRTDPAGAGARAHRHVAAAARAVPGGLDSWVVGPGGWYRLGCVDAACCPPGGRPLQELESAAVSAEMVLRGAQVAPSRAALGHVQPAPADARRAARRAAARWDARLGAADGTAPVHRWRLAGLRLWRAEVHRLAAAGEAARPAVPDATPATLAGRLCAALDDVLVRDAVLLSLVPGTESVAERVLAGEAGADVGSALRALVDPALGVPPDPALTAAARAVLVGVASHAPTRRGAPPLTLLGVLAWWEGDGARAGVLLERALSADPGYRLAALVREALDRGMPPGWLRDGGRPVAGPAGR